MCEAPFGPFRQKSPVPFFVPVVTVFAWLWLAAEILILWALTKRSAHYYQQLVPPTALLAAIGLSRLEASLSGLRLSERAAGWRWLMAVGLVLVVLAAMPLAAETASRRRTFDRAWEVREFNRWLTDWSPRSWAEPSQPAH